MENLIFVSEADIKNWIREAVRDEMREWRDSVNATTPSYDEPLLTRQEIAAYLHISLPTLQKWRKQGLPCISIGNRGVLFLKSAVLEAIKNGPPQHSDKKRKK